MSGECGQRLCQSDAVRGRCACARTAREGSNDALRPPAPASRHDGHGLADDWRTSARSPEQPGIDDRIRAPARGGAARRNGAASGASGSGTAVARAGCRRCHCRSMRGCRAGYGPGRRSCAGGGWWRVHSRGSSSLATCFQGNFSSESTIAPPPIERREGPHRDWMMQRDCSADACDQRSGKPGAMSGEA